VTRKTFLVVLALLAVAEAADTTDLVRGRVDRYVAPDIVTASGVKVVLWQGDTLRESMVTGQDGIFYFVNVPTGTYRLEINPPVQDSGLSPFPCRLTVRKKKVLDLPAQMLNRLAFEQPAEKASVRAGDTLVVAGTHSFPSGTVIWILFLTSRGEYRLPGDSVVLEAGRPWSLRLIVPNGAYGLLAVLATQKARGYYSLFVEQPTGKEAKQDTSEQDFKDLLPGARIVATRPFAKKAAD